MTSKAEQFQREILEEAARVSPKPKKPASPPPLASGKENENEILRLAKLSTFQYDKEREASAEKLGVRVPTLDSSVKAERGKFAKEQKDFLPHWSVEPWTEPVDGAALLKELRNYFGRYVVLPKWADVALALWVHGFSTLSTSRRIWRSRHRHDGAARRC
jgi:putative DNA primase/helicase